MPHRPEEALHLRRTDQVVGRVPLALHDEAAAVWASGDDIRAQVACPATDPDVLPPVPAEEPGDESLELAEGHAIGRCDLVVEEPLMGSRGSVVSASPLKEQHEAADREHRCEGEQRPPAHEQSLR